MTSVCVDPQGNGVWVPPEISGIDFTVAINNDQYNAGSCGMCIELTGEWGGSERVAGPATCKTTNHAVSSDGLCGL